ncbi:YfjI family protein [Xanthomonas sp. NCPPB 1325]|uniref:YfjI family protein n=1 Tax=Xanthomonas sp. NCPPB 1325 TaxID=487529 RepID=UPI0035584756
MIRPNLEHYPIDALTDSFFYAGKEVYDATQTPESLVALVLLSSAATVCQRLIDVVLPVAGGLVSPVSLYLMFIGESGERRSTVNSMIAAPIYDHDELASIKRTEYMSVYRSKREIWKLTKTRLLRTISQFQDDGMDIAHLELELIEHNRLEPRPPKQRKIVHQNMTETAIYEALDGDGQSISFITDEGQIMLESPTMRNLGLFNKLWDGPRTLPMHRADNKVVSAHNPRTSMHVMTHHPVVQKYLQKKGDIARGSGTLARFLMAMPPSTKGYREARNEPSVMPYLKKFKSRLGELLKLNEELVDPGITERSKLRFSDQASALWRRTANEIEHEMRPDDGRYAECSDVASKLMENASRIAAIMHLFEGHTGEIHEETLRRSIKIAQWHLHEFQRLFVDGSVPGEEVDAMALKRYLENKYWKFGVREVESTVVAHNCGIRPKARMDAAVDVLIRWQEITIALHERDKRKYMIRQRDRL